MSDSMDEIVKEAITQTGGIEDIVKAAIAKVGDNRTAQLLLGLVF